MAQVAAGDPSERGVATEPAAPEDLPGAQGRLAGLLRTRPAASGDSYVTPDRRWLAVARLLTGLYLVAGMVLVGIPAVSRGAAVVSLLCALWAIYGLITHKARFPRVLILPLLFYAMVALSGFQLDDYPYTYLGQLSTVWLAALAIGIFAANGMSLKVVLAGFLLVFVSNLAAMAVGYDGYARYGIAAEYGDFTAEVRAEDMERLSGLAGQPNLLMLLTAAPLALLFLRRRYIGLLAWALLTFGVGLMATLTGSRSGLTPMLLFALMGGFVLVRSNLLRRLLPVLVLVGAVLWLILSADGTLLQRIERSPAGELTVVKRLIEAVDGTDGSANERQRYIQQAWKPFLERPFLGSGPGKFAELVGRGAYAHNNPAELAVNFGVLGLGLWFGMYVVALVGVLRSPYKYPALCAIVMMLALEQTYVSHVERPVALVMCLLLVFCGRSLIRRSRRTFIEDAAPRES